MSVLVGGLDTQEGLQEAVQEVLQKAPRGVTVSIDEEQFLVLVVPLREEGFDRPWKAVFIGWLRRGITVQKAAHLAGVTRRHVYHCKRRDEVFREAWKQARKK